MKGIVFRSIFMLSALAVAPIWSTELPSADIQAVVDKFRSALPAADDLSVYRLDWVLSLVEAKQKAAREERPILLIVVTNSYGNLYSGHC